MSTPEFASAPFTAGQLNALVKMIGIENIPGILDGTLKTTIKQADLLKRIGTAEACGANKFVAKDCLREANVGWTNEDFNRLFLNKVEENISEAKLTVSRLERASIDAQILTELGVKAEVLLAHVFDLLKKQAKGEDGVLLTNGYWNVFYVRGMDDNLWAVSARWHSGFRCWSVEAYSVELPSRWNVGYQVLSRDS